MSKQLKNIIWNAFGTMFYFGCQWLLTVFAVHFKRGYSDAGVLSLAMSVSSPLVIVACLNLRTFQVSELEGRFSDGDFLINRILITLVSVVLCIGIVIYSGYGKYESVCIIAFMIFKLSEALADVLHGIDQKAWRLDIAGKSFVWRGLAVLFSTVIGMICGKSLTLTILIMMFSVYSVIFCYDYRVCKKQINPDFSYSRSHIVALIKTGIPLVLYSLFLNLISVYPKFRIEEQYGKELLGVFSSVATPTVLISQLSSFIFSPLMGIFAECKKEHDKKRLYILLLTVLCSTIAIGVFSVIAGKILGDWALVLLFGESIREYTYLLIPIIITAIQTAIIWLFCGLLTVFKDYFILAVLTFIPLFFCLIYSPFCIAEKQLMGAVFSMELSLSVEILLLVLRYLYLIRKC